MERTSLFQLPGHRMNAYRRWFLLALGVIVLIVGTMGLLNFLMDPYGIFRTDFTKQVVEPAKNFIKTRYIMQNPDKFDCLVFGSSRANGIDVRHVKAFRCYNMHHPMALPQQHLENLRYLLKQGVRPKVVVVTLDDFSFKIDPRERSFQPMTHHYPPVRDESLLLYYLKYFFSIFERRTRNIVMEEAVGPKSYRPEYDHYNSGMVYNPTGDKGIEEHPEQHVKDPKFNEPFYSKGDNVKETLDEMREMVALCRHYGVRLIVLMNPTHKTTYLSSDLEQYLRFEKELAGITDFYDFSGLNSITTNNYYYYETSHYRQKVGDMIIGRIFEDPSLSVPQDFGVLVTKENVDRHLETMRQQVQDLKAKEGKTG